MTAPIMLDIRSIAETRISRYTVGFLDRSADVPKSLGSATLIRFGAKEGLLTCAHVAHALETRSIRGLDHVGIVMFPAREGAIQNTIFNISHMAFTTIGEPPFGDRGPDIAFIELSPVHMATLKAQASIVDGDLQFEISKSPQPDAKCIQAVSGVIEQWTRAEPRNDKTLAWMQGLTTVGHVNERFNDPGLDVIQFDIDPDQQIILPDSYGGTSGGGIWRLFYELDDKQEIKLIERRLLGVAFFQKPGQILGHGPTAVYRHLRNKVLGLEDGAH